MEIISGVFLIIGGLFYALGGLGIFRMPDTFDRIQAGTKATTLGVFSILIGVAFMFPSWSLKLFLIALFIVLSNPIGSSALAKATYRSFGGPSNVERDDLKEFLGGTKDVD
ncbi:MAG: monovalent cation/H(+) antiporter subunit G [Candidatus Izemoplasmataceae bacterium]